MNPYMVFSQEQRAKIVKADPSRKADIGGVAKEIGKLWHKLSDAEKAGYKGKTRKASKTSKSSKKEKAPATPKATTRKASKGKRALSPYMKFFKANYSRVSKAHPGGVTVVAKEIGKLWAKQK
jgi:hypothetical protein